MYALLLLLCCTSTHTCRMSRFCFPGLFSRFQKRGRGCCSLSRHENTVSGSVHNTLSRHVASCTVFVFLFLFRLSSRLTQVTWDDLGMERSHDLLGGGADVPVRADNKEEYVELYANFLLSDAVSRQFDRFKQGFLRVMSGASTISLLR